MKRIAVGTETTSAAVRMTVKPGPPPSTDCSALSRGITGRVSGLWVRMSERRRSFQTQVAWRMKTTTSALVDIGTKIRVKIRLGLAPSTTAASNTDSAMPEKKLRMTKAENGVATTA